jgi:hypothetical protein
MTSASAPCANHPTREALGICVHCKRLVCSECSTRIDGVNHCVSCLDERAGADARSDTEGGPAFDRVLLVGGAVAFVAIVRAILELALRRG